MDADREAVRILLKLVRILGICPYDPPLRFDRFYQKLMLFLTFSVTIAWIYGNFVTRYPNLSTMDTFIDLLMAILMIIQGIACQVTFLIHSKIWRKLIQELNLGKEKYSKISVYVEFFAIHFFLGVRAAWNMFVLLVILRWEYNPYLICRALCEYYEVLFVMLMLHINGIIKREFRLIHVKLSKNTMAFYNQFQPTSVRELESTYRRLSFASDHFNKLFGYPILFTMACAVAMMLHTLCNMLKFYDISRLVLCSTMINTTFVLVFLVVSYFV